MSIPPSSRWRGCASSFSQPLSDEDHRSAQFLVETVHYFNCYVSPSPLEEIIYRSSDNEGDILNHVFRWDRLPYHYVFQKGIQVNRKQDTADEMFYDLAHHVGSNNSFLDSGEPATSVFISTTLDSSRSPQLEESWVSREMYRYEIYAPGGIWAFQSLRRNGREEYAYKSHDDVCFVAGIDPQYIRSAQLFRVISDDSSDQTRLERVKDSIIINGNFNPQSHPQRNLNISLPVYYCLDRETEKSHRLSVSIYNGGGNNDTTAAVDGTITDWYARKVAEEPPHGALVDAAFRCTEEYHGYIFMKNTCLLLHYSKDPVDKILAGPSVIRDAFPSLAGTAFGEHGIDCAFGSHKKHKAFIFSGNLCAEIDYAPGGTARYDKIVKGTTTAQVGTARYDKIVKGPTTISRMFPFLKRTVFQSSVVTAFEHVVRQDEAFLYKDEQYAHINYGWNPHLIAIGQFSQGFPYFKSKRFEDGFDSALTAHVDQETYVFKGREYGVFCMVNPGRRVSGDTLEKWPGIWSAIAQRLNGALDVPKPPPQEKK